MNHKYIHLMTVVATIAVFAGAATGSSTQRIFFSSADCSLTADRGLTRIQGPMVRCIGQPGFPELPAISYKYLIPSGRQAVGIRVLSATKSRLPGEYTVYPAQPLIPVDGSDVVFQSPDPEAYSSESPYPSEPLESGL